MLSNTLDSNEVKNAANSEVEFQALSIGDRQRVYGQVSETPSAPHRLSVKHTETGLGIKHRRRSLIRVDKTVISSVDNVTPVTASAYIVLDAPVGALTAATELANVLAELGSFVYTTDGATLLHNGTGNGAAALLTGGI